LGSWAALLYLLLFSLLLAASNSTASTSYINPQYPDIEYWGQWAADNGYTIDDYVYSEGNTTGIDNTVGNEFVCIRDDVNEVIIGRPDVCGTYYSGLGYSFADITTDPNSLVSAPNIIDDITDNLVNPDLSTWNGCDYTGVDKWAGYSGGPRPNCGDIQINWSYGGYWVYQRHAIEEALKQAGVNVEGYQWEFRIKNYNANRTDQNGIDDLLIQMRIWDKSGNEVHTKTWDYSYTIPDWTTFSGTELFANSLIGENLQDWQIQMYGRDTGYWAGFYGPEMLAPEIRMIYSSDPCAIDSLLHPDCDGYVEAYGEYLFEQQCIANPLFDPSCSGYEQAYFTQQCNAYALYDPGCPGYEEAYYDQQCSIDALYDPGCTGYADALFEQQCSLDPFYDTDCAGYEQAYTDQQCELDPLYDPTCAGYAEAFYDQQCAANPLYDSGCAGYESAFYDQQCSLNALYDSGCPGYAEAFYDQQCSINPLYDSGCPGYEQAYFDQQCSVDPLYNESCTGYANAFFAQQCSLDALYDSQCPGYAQAFYNQQCELDALYDAGCAGYEAAYYDKYIKPTLDRQAEQAAGIEDENTETSTAENNKATITDPVADLVNPSVTGNSTIDEVLRENNNVSNNKELDSVAGVDASSVSPAPIETSPSENTENSTQSEESNSEEQEITQELDNMLTEDESSDDSNTGESLTDAESQNENSSPEESKREKIKQLLVERAMNLAETMSTAASLEAQQALQRQIMAIANYVPGFNAYGQLAIPGVDFYSSRDIYEDKEVPENQRGLRNGLAQQILHERMVEQQYEETE